LQYDALIGKNYSAAATRVVSAGLQ
jgi:hypothetical protein